MPSFTLDLSSEKILPSKLNAAFDVTADIKGVSRIRAIFDAIGYYLHYISTMIEEKKIYISCGYNTF